MGAMASQITSLTIVHSSVYSGADQRKHQSSVPLAYVRWIHGSLVNSPYKRPVMRKMFPFDDVIIVYITLYVGKHCRLPGFYLPTEADLYIDRYCQGSTYRTKTLHLYFAMLDKFHRSREQPGSRVLGYIAFTNVANQSQSTCRIPLTHWGRVTQIIKPP